MAVGRRDRTGAYPWCAIAIPALAGVGGRVLAVRGACCSLELAIGEREAGRRRAEERQVCSERGGSAPWIWRAGVVPRAEEVHGGTKCEEFRLWRGRTGRLGGPGSLHLRLGVATCSGVAEARHGAAVLGLMWRWCLVGMLASVRDDVQPRWCVSWVKILC